MQPFILPSKKKSLTSLMIHQNKPFHQINSLTQNEIELCISSLEHKQGEFPINLSQKQKLFNQSLRNTFIFTPFSSCLVLIPGLDAAEKKTFCLRYDVEIKEAIDSTCLRHRDEPEMHAFGIARVRRVRFRYCIKILLKIKNYDTYNIF